MEISNESASIIHIVLLIMHLIVMYFSFMHSMIAGLLCILSSIIMFLLCAFTFYHPSSIFASIMQTMIGQSTLSKGLYNEIKTGKTKGSRYKVKYDK